MSVYFHLNRVLASTSGLRFGDTVGPVKRRIVLSPARLGIQSSQIQILTCNITIFY
jgi:hypothetical protein